MTVLGIDTSTLLGGVALADGERLLGETRCDARAAASERILPQLDRLLEDLGLTRGAITRIGVAIGPGSFTGVRVGLATAKGLAVGLRVPLLAVSSIEARGFALGAGERATIIVSAPRRGEVFAGGGFRDGAGYRTLLPEAARALDRGATWVREALHAAREAGRLPLLCAGDGVAVLLASLGDELPGLAAAGLLPMPAAVAGAVPGAVAQLTALAPDGALVAGEALDALVPVYLRGSEARRPAAAGAAPGAPGLRDGESV
jgi:tRNA threonylcarbamoyladenosine biosynthesis protein TsaB